MAVFGGAPKADSLLNPAEALPNSFSKRSDVLFGRAPRADSLLNPAGALQNNFSDRSDSLLIP